MKISDEEHLVIVQPAGASSTAGERVDNKDTPKTESADKVQSDQKDGVEERPTEATYTDDTSVRKRPAQDDDDDAFASNEQSGELDAMKAKLLGAKSRRNKKKKS